MIGKTIVWILFGCFMVSIGALIGYNCRPDANGIYVQLVVPTEQEVLFKVGEPVQDCDIKTFTEAQSIILVLQIEKLKREDYLSGLLRDLRDREDDNGPFGTREIPVTVKFTEDGSINGVLASTCKNKRHLLGKKFSLLSNSAKRSLYCETRIEHFGADCNNPNDIIWISKKTATEWFDAKDSSELPEKVVVTAKELRKIFL